MGAPQGRLGSSLFRQKWTSPPGAKAATASKRFLLHQTCLECESGHPGDNAGNDVGTVPSRRIPPEVILLTARLGYDLQISRTAEVALNEADAIEFTDAPPKGCWPAPGEARVVIVPPEAGPARQKMQGRRLRSCLAYQTYLELVLAPQRQCQRCWG